MGDFVRPFLAWQRSAGPIALPVVEPVPAVPGAQLDPCRFDAAPKNDAATWNDGEPFWVLNSFVDWIHANGGPRVMGYVISGAFPEGGRLEWRPGNPAEHQVLRGQTGLEVLRMRHPLRAAG